MKRLLITGLLFGIGAFGQSGTIIMGVGGAYTEHRGGCRINIDRRDMTLIFKKWEDCKSVEISADILRAVFANDPDTHVLVERQYTSTVNCSTLTCWSDGGSTIVSPYIK